MQISIQVTPKENVAKYIGDWLYSLSMERPNLALAVLLSGDRLSCVTDIAIATLDNCKIAGIATIATNGEQMSGTPTIVALYVDHKYRNKGIGFKLFEAAIDYMLDQGFEPIRVDVLNSKVMKIIKRLSIKKRSKMNIIDASMNGALDSILDM